MVAECERQEESIETITYLINVVEVRFHAFDGDILVRLGRLGLEHLRERSFSLLADESVLCEQAQATIRVGTQGMMIDLKSS